MVVIQTGIETTLLHRPGHIPKHDKGPKHCPHSNEKKVLLLTQTRMANDATVEEKRRALITIRLHPDRSVRPAGSCCDTLVAL